MSAIEGIDRYGPVPPKQADVLSGLFDIPYIPIQPMHYVAVIYAQGGRQLPISTADMYNKTAVDARGV
jgi:hypothetical protein